MGGFGVSRDRVEVSEVPHGDDGVGLESAGDFEDETPRLLVVVGRVEIGDVEDPFQCHGGERITD